MGTVVHHSDGSVIHERGDQKPGLSVVESGTVRVGNYGLDGHYIQTALLTRGESFGEFTLFSDLPRTHTAEAVGEASVIQLSEKPFKSALDQNPELALEIISSLSTRFYWTLEMLDDLKRLPLTVRTAKLILELLMRQGDFKNLEISQDQLAARLGVSRVSISKTLTKLENEKVLERGYGRLIIPDFSYLRRWIARSSQTGILSPGVVREE